MNNLMKLFNIIMNMKGAKMVTVYNYRTNTGKAFGISNEGIIGTEANMDVFFRMKLASAFCDGGSVIIRQYTGLKDNDKQIKKLYGITLENGHWYPSTKEDLESAYNVENAGIEPDKYTIFSDLSEVV